MGSRSPETIALTSRARNGGLVVIAGAGVFFAGAAIPFLTHVGGWPGGFERLVAAVSADPVVWGWANGLIAVAAGVVTVGLVVGTSGGLGESPLAKAGLAVFVMAAGAEAASRIALITVPERATSETLLPFAAFASGLHVVFMSLGFLALVLYGLALSRSGMPAAGFGLVTLGAGGLVTEAIPGAGLIPAFVYFGVVALGVLLTTRTDPIEPPATRG